MNRCASCDAGETAPSSTCSSQHYVTATQQRVGYITSDVTQTTGVGSERCPWLVVVRRGQRIRITLYDLATAPSSQWSGQRQSAQPQEGRCLLYATLREGLESDVVGDHMICSGGGAREQVVYTSRDHTLAITIHYAPGTRFVLQYEGLCGQQLSNTIRMSIALVFVGLGLESVGLVKTLSTFVAQI